MRLGPVNPRLPVRHRFPIASQLHYDLTEITCEIEALEAEDSIRLLYRELPAVLFRVSRGLCRISRRPPGQHRNDGRRDAYQRSNDDAEHINDELRCLEVGRWCLCHGATVSFPKQGRLLHLRSTHGADRRHP